ncbi:MAG: alanine racemase [Chitinivibrionales bacterium]|nr:alanine racemase [Chitinivibrionales bacterium]
MTKKMYVKPTFSKHVIGVMNKFGNAYSKNYRDAIDGVSINSLIEDFGSPLFVFSEKTLRRQYRDLHEAFSSRYPNVQFSWSYKTNYMGAICSLFHQEGEYAEVVSEFEYDRARLLGVKPQHIIFNGPYKGDGLKKALSEGAIVNLDNFNEIVAAEEAAKQLHKKVKIGIRMNMDTGIYPQWSKFGFNYDNKQAHEAINRIMRSENLQLTGFHTHLGTFILEPNAYAIAVEKMVGLLQEVEKQYETTLEYLDLGGGFPSRNRLKGTYLAPDVAIPNLDEYAEAICGTLLRNLKPKSYPKLFLETGRALVDEAGYLITTVVAQKQLPEGIKSYIVDSGINLLYTATWYNFSIQPDRQINGTPEMVRVYGDLCMNIDCIADSVYLPPLALGNRLILHPVGAYNVTQWMQFITYRPAIVMVNEEKRADLIRRKETMEDVINCETIPKRYQFKEIGTGKKKSSAEGGAKPKSKEVNDTSKADG